MLFPFVRSVWFCYDFLEVIILDKILYITGKQVIGLQFDGFRVGSLFATNVVWPVVNQYGQFSGWTISLLNTIATLEWKVVSLFHQKFWSLSNAGLFQLENSDVADSTSLVFISLYAPFVMLLMKIWYSCSHAPSLLYSFFFSYSGYQNISTSSLVGGSVMVIRFPCSSLKSFDWFSIKLLFCRYLLVFSSFDIWRAYF